jgi:small subunit ribosomal protein S20
VSARKTYLHRLQCDATTRFRECQILAPSSLLLCVRAGNWFYAKTQSVQGTTLNSQTENAFTQGPQLDTTECPPYTPKLRVRVESALRVTGRRGLRDRILLEIFMPNHKSAEKRMRQSENRRQINRSSRTRLRGQIRKLRAAMTAGKTQELSELLPATVSIIDKAVQKGVLHKNAAARHKSRLTARVKQAAAK